MGEMVPHTSLTDCILFKVHKYEKLHKTNKQTTNRHTNKNGFLLFWVSSFTVYLLLFLLLHKHRFLVRFAFPIKQVK